MFAVLTLSLSLAAAPPTKSHATDVLRTQCLLWAADPKNPWALAHGITGLGPRFLANDGRAAAEVIVDDFLIQNRLPDGGVGPGAPMGFERYGKDGTPIEPHSNLNVKTLFAEAKLPREKTFKARFGTISLQQLIDATKAGFRHVPASADYWHDVGWTLSLFAASEKPGTTWSTPDGVTINLDHVFDDALDELEKEDADLGKGLDTHQPQVDKRKQGLYAHSCGGLHFVQGVVSWARNPAVRKKWQARLDRQLAIHFYRLESERHQYDVAYQQTLTSMPQYKLQVLVQMVKFYGHWLETLMHFRDDAGWKPTDAQRQDIQRAKAYLDVAVRALEENKAFESMESLKKSQPQVYLDLIGDSCHAVHGLEAFK